MANVSCRIAVRVTLVGLAFAASLVPAACTRQPAPELARDELFSLSLGPLDEQLDLFRIGGSAVRDATRISMRDGLFYIANGNAGKVLQLSSYGDLLLIIYDPRRNPAPVGLAAAAATRLAVPHALHEPRHVAVDSEQRIFVADAVPDAAAGAQGQLVQRFASGGRHLGALGREGVGGTPFPHIQHLAVTTDDLLVVIARTPRQWLGYWYDAAGRLQEQVELPYVGALGDEEALVVWEVMPQLTERSFCCSSTRRRRRAGRRIPRVSGTHREYGYMIWPRAAWSGHSRCPPAGRGVAPRPAAGKSRRRRRITRSA